MTVINSYISIQTVSNFSLGLAAAFADVAKKKFTETYILGVVQGLEFALTFVKEAEPEIPKVKRDHVMQIFKDGLANGQAGLHEIVQRLDNIVSISLFPNFSPLYTDITSVIYEYV